MHFSITAAATIDTAAPSRYNENTSRILPRAKNAEAIAVYTGNLAEHDINGVSITVFFRIVSSSSPRAVSTAVAEHPTPVSIVNTDLPESPILRKKPSVIKATRLT